MYTKLPPCTVRFGLEGWLLGELERELEGVKKRDLVRSSILKKSGGGS